MKIILLCCPGHHSVHDLMQLKYVYAFLLSCFLPAFNSFAQYNAAALNPGRRIQYGPELKWNSYRTSFAHFYFAAGTDSLCKYTLANYPPLLKRLEQESGLKSRGINNIIIYPSVYKFFETNIGSHNPRTYSYPTISFDAGGRILIAFKGSYARYTRDLGLGLARHLWEKNIEQSGLLNSTGPVAPELQWFREGFLDYLASGFSLADNERLFNFISDSSLRGVPALLQGTDREQQVLLSKGFCWFLTQHYRKDALKQIVFQLKQKKSFETAVRLVTKRNWQELMLVYTAYLQHIYKLPGKPFNAPADTGRQARNIVQYDTLFSNPDSSRLFISRLRNNRKMIYLARGDKKEVQPLKSFQSPLWLETTESAYPLAAAYMDKWYLLYLEHGVHYVCIYNHSGKVLRTIELPELISGIIDFKVLSEEDWLLTAYTRGRSDLVRFNPKRYTLRAITNDLADNTALAMMPESPGRVSYRSGFPEALKRDTTVFSHAKAYGTYSLAIDSKEPEEVLLHSDSADFEQTLEVFKRDKALVPLHQRYWLQAYSRQEQERDSLERAAQQRKEENSTSFLSGVFASAQLADTAKTAKEELYDARKVRPYLLQLSNLWFNASVNNDYFINRLQPYQSQLGIYKFPEVGAMLTGGYADIFDNHEFNIGYKMPAGTEGSDFFFRYKNKKQKTDWWLMYYRKVESLKPTGDNQWFDALGRPYPPTAKVKSFYYEAGIDHPFNYYSAISLTVALRQNRTVFLSTDKYSLQYPPLKELWNINTLTYTYNNIRSVPERPMMLKGIRYKAMLDAVVGVERKSRFSYGITQSLDGYQPIYPWLNGHYQVAAGYSGGPERILYNFGGMDNNVIVRIDSAAVFAQDAPYVFQQLVAPLRGFRQNTMWGNAYGLVNAELFAQVFNGIIPGKTRFSFINLLQLGAFMDVAYSRATWQPGSDWQRRNSFGLSLKTILANYPIRVDMAFPYNLDHKPMVHLSLKL